MCGSFSTTRLSLLLLPWHLPVHNVFCSLLSLSLSIYYYYFFSKNLVQLIFQKSIKCLNQILIFFFFKLPSCGFLAFHSFNSELTQYPIVGHYTLLDFQRSNLDINNQTLRKQIILFCSNS